jgi:hypothetical protein
MHIACVWSWCLCAFVLVVSSFFGPLVLPYYPLWKLLPDTGLKGISEETVIWKLSSTIWNFPLTAWWRELPGLAINSILDWLSTHISATFIAEIIESARRQIGCPIHRTSQIKGMVTMHGLSRLWVQVKPWNIPDASQNVLWSTGFSKKDSWIPCCLQQVTDSRNIKGYIYALSPYMAMHSESQVRNRWSGCKTQSGHKSASEIKCQLHMILQKGWVCCQGHRSHSYNDVSPV